MAHFFFVQWIYRACEIFHKDWPEKPLLKPIGRQGSLDGGARDVTEGAIVPISHRVTTMPLMAPKINDRIATSRLSNAEP